MLFVLQSIFWGGRWAKQPVSSLIVQNSRESDIFNLWAAASGFVFKLLKGKIWVKLLLPTLMLFFATVFCWQSEFCWPNANKHCIRKPPLFSNSPIKRGGFPKDQLLVYQHTPSSLYTSHLLFRINAGWLRSILLRHVAKCLFLLPSEGGTNRTGPLRPASWMDRSV